MSEDVLEEAIALYFWPTPNGLKISIMLEELGLPYRVHYVDIGKGEQFAADFLKVSPNNRIPAVVDPEGPDGQPIAIFESGAILQYLGRKQAQFYSTNERRKADIDQWLFWQIGGLGPMAGQFFHFNKYATEKIPYAIARYKSEVTRLFGVMDRRLADVPYLAGEYSIADTGTFNLSSAGIFDIFVSKLDVSGNHVWATSMGSTLNDRGDFVTVDVSGNVYTTGYFQGTVDFDPNVGIANLTSVGGQDIFINKWNVGRVPVASIPESKVRIYPSVTTGQLTIEGVQSFEIVNIMGQVMLSEAVIHHSSFNIHHYTSGIYCIRGKNTEGVFFSEKIIKQ